MTKWSFWDAGHPCTDPPAPSWCVPGVSANKAESLAVPRSTGLRTALGFLGRLWSLAVWMRCPEAPAAWMLAVSTVLLLSGKSWAKHLDALENPVGACQWF